MSQVVDYMPNPVLDTKSTLGVLSLAMAKKRKVPEAVKFKPDDREKRIIEAGQTKYGLKTAQDILSMALQHWARAEQIAS